MKFKTTLLLLATLLSHLACGSGNSDSDSKSSNDKQKTSENGEETGIVTLDFLKGKWVSPCETRDDGNEESYYQYMEINFVENGKLYVSESKFHDSDCQSLRSSGEQQELSYILGELVQIENNQKVRELDIVFPNGKTMQNLIQRVDGKLRTGKCDSDENDDCMKSRATKMEDKYLSKASK